MCWVKGFSYVSYFSNSICEVLNEKLAEVVQGVELTSLQCE